MSRFSPAALMGIGVLLMLVGILLPFLMVIQVLTSTYFLNFFAYTCSLVGLILAFTGLVNWTYSRRK